jgi:hypothetical protein
METLEERMWCWKAGSTFLYIFNKMPQKEDLYVSCQRRCVFEQRCVNGETDRTNKSSRVRGQ